MCECTARIRLFGHMPTQYTYSNSEQQQWSRFMCIYKICVITELVCDCAHPEHICMWWSWSFFLILYSHCARWYICDWMWMWERVSECVCAHGYSLARTHSLDCDDIETLAILLPPPQHHQTQLTHIHSYSLSMALKSLTFLWVCIFASIERARERKKTEYACACIFHRIVCTLCIYANTHNRNDMFVKAAVATAVATKNSKKESLTLTRTQPDVCKMMVCKQGG